MSFSRRHANQIALFRGLPPDETISFGRHTQGKALLIEDLIDEFLDVHQIGRLTPQQSLVNAWKELLGTDAERCCAERIDSSGNLVVSVPNPVLRNQLRFRKNGLLKRIRELPECSFIREIVLVA